MIEEEFLEGVVGFSVRGWLEVCLGWKNVEKVVQGMYGGSRGWKVAGLVRVKKLWLNGDGGGRRNCESLNYEV